MRRPILVFAACLLPVVCAPSAVGQSPPAAGSRLEGDWVRIDPDGAGSFGGLGASDSARAAAARRRRRRRARRRGGRGRGGRGARRGPAGRAQPGRRALYRRRPAVWRRWRRPQ